MQAGDLQDVVALLSLSLGNDSTVKSEAYWKWKHQNNPFGPSEVLLAVHNGRIIGVRAFMHWQWQGRGRLLRAVRAVDTATHPDFQGKGVFKKLTLACAERCKQQGIHIVFNTPNAVSQKGYLSMGWQVAGRLPVSFCLKANMPRSFSSHYEAELKKNFPIPKKMENEFSLQQVAEVSESFVTPLSSNYVQWRYNQCPVARYGFFSGQQVAFIFRLKPLKRFIELRICDYWCCNPSASSQEVHLENELKSLIREIRPLAVTWCKVGNTKGMSCDLSRVFAMRQLQPSVTIRPLVENNLSDFHSFANWQPSIGAMELF